MKKSGEEIEDLDGTLGFSPQLGGNGKAGQTHTSGFQTPLRNIPVVSKDIAQPVPEKKRHPISSIMNRIK